MTAKTAPEPVAEGLAKLRTPFPTNQISKLPKESKAQREERERERSKGVSCQVCGGWHHRNAVHLDYVGHAALTDRLLDTDPNWTWEPVAFAQNGLPALDGHGGMWIRLTVCGVTRLGYGHAGEKKGGDAVKEIIGDALRNAAMRFGAALDLWHKGDLHALEEAEAEDKGEPAKPEPEARKAPTLAERATRLITALAKADTQADLRKTFDLASGLCADLDRSDPERLAEVEALYKRRFAELDQQEAA